MNFEFKILRLYVYGSEASHIKSEYGILIKFINEAQNSL